MPRPMAHRIRHVDAFTSVPLEGNPAAVVGDGGEIGIDGATMQRIALNQKLSETVFLLPPTSPDNHARVRIFTPDRELPFAGHPIVATAHVLASEGLVRLEEGEALRIETGAGVIPVEVNGGRYTMTQVPAVFEPSPVSHEEIAAALGLGANDIVRAERVSTGIFWLVAQLASFETMLRVRPDMTRLQDIEISVFCIGAGTPDVAIRVRTFAPGAGVFEDPVTGSANGCIASFIAEHALLPAENGAIAYIAEQGIEMGQPGRVYARVSGMPDAPRAHIGGEAVTVLTGELLLPG